MFLPSLLGAASLALAQQSLVINPKLADDSSGHVPASSVDLSSFVHNRGFATAPNDADFDSYADGFPAQLLPGPNVTLNGVQFTFPQYQSNGGFDNMFSAGQTITPKQGKYFNLHLLTAAEGAIAEGPLVINYADGTSATQYLSVDPFTFWAYPYGGDLIFPYFYTCCGQNFNRSMIYYRELWLDSTKTLVNFTLPNFGTNGGTNRLHVFAISMNPANYQGTALQIQYARSTQKWIEGTNKTQIFEVTVNNVGEQVVSAKDKVQVAITGNGVQTTVPGVINRLLPGDQIVVPVGVTTSAAPGSQGQVVAQVTGSGGISSSITFNARLGIAQYTSDYTSIYSHEAPNWYRNAKFGIFIHWGVYSVPGWGNSGSREQYAEWYWNYLNQGPNYITQTYQYHEQTFGPNVTYDDFVKNFTASAWSPKAWVDLFAASGAQYFVPTTKHHDGWSLFDAPHSSTLRTTVQYGPKRDLIQELFNAAAQYQPQLRRGTYFSLPEWYSPDFGKYGFQAWLGGPTTNPFTGAVEPYTGHVNVNDYLQDIMGPQMQKLADMGTELMWCDGGGPNVTMDFASKFFNSAAQQGRQVLLNNRCGLPGDFDTPEYARYNARQTRKWESNLGMDPFSYGYNRATPVSAYLSPSGIVTSLMDIVSKNGNFLLDIGPTANGSIIAVEQNNLRAAGTWIKGHAEAIFNTTFWYVAPEDGNLRYTQNNNAFYITSLQAPPNVLTTSYRVPYLSGDKVTVVGGKMANTVVPSQQLANGSLVLNISQAIIAADQYSWVFKIPFGGVAQSL